MVDRVTRAGWGFLLGRIEGWASWYRVDRTLGALDGREEFAMCSVVPTVSKKRGMCAVYVRPSHRSSSSRMEGDTVDKVLVFGERL